MKNCPTCGTPMMNGWCPRCHPNPARARDYNVWSIGVALQRIGCLMMMIPALLLLALLIYGCAGAVLHS